MRRHLSRKKSKTKAMRGLSWLDGGKKIRVERPKSRFLWVTKHWREPESGFYQGSVATLYILNFQLSTVWD